MRDVSPFARAALLAASLLGILACSTDTAGLARRAPSGGAAGTDADAAPGGSGGSDSSAGAAAGGSGTTSPPDDPAGGSIEVVHGLVDGGSLFACVRDAASAEPLGDDAPEPSEGIAYGRGWSLPIGWDVAARDVEVELFVAVPAAVAGLSCSALRDRAELADPLPLPVPDAGPLDAGPAPEPPFPVEPTQPRRAGSVRLAPGVVRAGGHYALVAAGCTQPGGGAANDVCGPADDLFGARQELVLAEIANELGARDDSFGLQFLNASRALSRGDLALQWESQREPLGVSSEVGFGAVRPRDAAQIDDEPIGLELHVRGESLSSFTQLWSDAVQASSAGVFARGGNYLAVYIGPLPGAVIAGVSPPRFVLVPGRAAPDGAALAQ
ncbi:MAG TPA: hypothetical protein VMG12_05030 [Polyangiaceae bacterium]|nr:hypothetical protein [Polyangiaceae bacterium]